jgi:acetyl esterase/lipase
LWFKSLLVMKSTHLWRAFFLLLALVIARAEVAAQAVGKQLVLWPDGAPGAIGKEADDIPTLTLYLPQPDKATGVAIIICPGGGYLTLAEHEGRPVAEWLNSIGIAAFVLKYRHAPRYRYPAPIEDAARAIRTVRARAAEWGVSKDRIGILGFSAGGHLASTIATHFDYGRAGASDPIERTSSRPDLLILIYPVITMRSQAYTHQGSKRNLLGENPSPELVQLLSNEEHVSKQTPPTFLIHTVEDAAVPYENSLLFAAALRKAGVPHELHIYERGRHGFGLAVSDPILSSWTKRCADWLRLHGAGGPSERPVKEAGRPGASWLSATVDSEGPHPARQGAMRAGEVMSYE